MRAFCPLLVLLAVALHPSSVPAAIAPHLLVSELVAEGHLVGTPTTLDSLSRAGTEVRITATSTSALPAKGTILTVDNETLVLKARGTDSLYTVPLRAIDELSILLGRKTRTGTGLLIGAGAGLLIGVIVAIATDPDYGAWEPLAFVPRVVVGGTKILSFTAGGALVGGAIGFVSRKEVWEEVELPPSGGDYQATGKPYPALAVSLRF